jgi:rod shape-determining protein MreD
VISLPLAAAGAVIAALLETSVFSDLRPLGVKPDLVFAFAIVTAMAISVEDGLVWAFLGGTLLDILVPERPIGSTALALLVATGLSAVVGRVLPQTRVVLPVVAVFLLTWLYHLLTFAIISATTGASLFDDPLVSLLPVAVVNAVVAFFVALLARWFWLRFGQHDRLEW